MGSGFHGGFGATKGAQTRKRIFTSVQFEGTVKVNGIERDVSRRVYQRNDINFNYVDKDTGQTNLQRMLKGNAPYGRDGKPLELHHILQKEVGPMVEIHETTHQEYKTILHGLRGSGESFRNDGGIDNIVSFYTFIPLPTFRYGLPDQHSISDFSFQDALENHSCILQRKKQPVHLAPKG